MIDYSETNRLSRLTAILLQLQTKQLVTAVELATRFDVSKRTIYRDIKALQQAGVPIITEEGRGYSLMRGYKIPPVMFTEKQANALILAEQLVLNSKDESFVKDYSDAIDKIKAILKYAVKDKTQLLTSRTQYKEVLHKERNSNNLSDLQNALTNYRLVKIDYINKDQSKTTRVIEPFAILYSDHWYVIAYCRLRKEFRFFRPDRMLKMDVLEEEFEPHNLTLQEYFDQFQKSS